MRFQVRFQDFRIRSLLLTGPDFISDLSGQASCESLGFRLEASWLFKLLERVVSML